ncbi:histidine kinase [Polaribacter pectinis]|uniref:Histidine kinase n=1 Tax=Polaribacter pectinis TaxID=2738844 RepID=A0A7G9LAL0_9FLAO|nr:histidine kinase [Polaribacter pectinis]QNM85659.1 histidine kinase [Polaribacter pectinis]
MQKNIFFSVRKVGLHFLFWFLIWFFFYVFFSVGTSNKEFLFWFSTILSVISIVASYVFVYDLIPNYLLEKKHKQFALYSFYASVFVTTAVLMTMAFGFVFFFNLEFQQMPMLTKSASVILVCVLLIVALASSLKILKHNYKSLEEKKHLETRFLQTQLQLKEQELKFLKMQIHPHFLFNSLNTIYGFAIKKADETPDMILKLSNLLDYILYQVDKPTVVLDEEINHLEDYISLEKMRFHDTLEVNFKKENTNKLLQIPPMLLIPFLENSFKHGAIVQEVLKVDINLKTDDNSLFFKVENTSKETAKSISGIGLENIKKRLEMLFPNKYQLEILEEKSIFRVTLRIDLKKK